MSEKKEVPVQTMSKPNWDKLDATMMENVFVEVYDEANNRWLIVCPFTQQVYTSKPLV